MKLFTRHICLWITGEQWSAILAESVELSKALNRKVRPSDVVRKYIFQSQVKKK